MDSAIEYTQLKIWLKLIDNWQTVDTCAYKMYDIVERSNVWLRGVSEVKEREIKNRMLFEEIMAKNVPKWQNYIKSQTSE